MLVVTLVELYEHFLGYLTTLANDSSNSTGGNAAVNGGPRLYTDDPALFAGR